MHDDLTVKSFWEKKIRPWEIARYSSRAVFYPTSWTVRHRLELAAKMVASRLQMPKRILELACGSGYLAERIAPVCSAYLGIDIAEPAVVEARRRITAPRLRFETGDVMEMDWPQSDLIIFLGLIDWLEADQVRALFEKCKAPQILFSYTQPSTLNPYRLYRSWVDGSFELGFSRAKNYEFAFLLETMTANGYKPADHSAPSWVNPGGLVWASR